MEYAYAGQPVFPMESERNSQLHYAHMANHHPHQFDHTSAAIPESLDHQSYYLAQNQPQIMPADKNPRLTKEQHDVLEAQFQKQQKPNTTAKKGFAETLNVPLEKINNWFQNRRAKSKQDAKKQAGVSAMFTEPCQPQSKQKSQISFSSESEPEPSPAFPSSEYYSAMKEHLSDDQSQTQSQHSSGSAQSQDFGQQAQFNDSEQYQSFQQQDNLSADMFDSPQDLQRRTMTQEQFDALSHNTTNYDSFQYGFSGEDGVMNNTILGMNNEELKQMGTYDFTSAQMGPLSAGLSINSGITDMSAFMASSNSWDDSDMSAPHSDWTGSRSSSVSFAHSDEQFPHMPVAQHDPVTATGQWQPGQSVPVDFNALNQEFRQVAQSRQPAQMHPHAQVQQPQTTRRDSSVSMLAQQRYMQAHAQEMQNPWSTNDATTGSESSAALLAQASMLTQAMSSVGIHTPQPQQSSSFKAPPPPASIAARRQRPRPAALGIVSLRSQSYSGSTQPGSPGQAQSAGLTSEQTLRRIRSSSVINGVAQGRVQKQQPGSAQRSPLAWNFAESITSPKAARHASSSSQSSGNLAPPTPLSPHGGLEWHNTGRHPSISESDLENNCDFGQSFPNEENFSSPPHTPMYHQFAQQRMGTNVINENTPPQSAPASQSCFPASIYSQSQPNMQSVLQQQEYANGMGAGVFPLGNTAVAPQQQSFATATTSSNVEMPIQFANGIPMFNAQGQLTLGFPSQANLVQHQPKQIAQPTPQQPTAAAQGQFGQFSIAKTPPVSQANSQSSKPGSTSSTELLVHEYSPPDDVARAVVTRKPEPSCPKNYTFANHGPEHFEKSKVKGLGVVTSTSPESNSSA